MSTKVTDCDCFDCKYNSWRAKSKILNCHRNARQRHTCTLSGIHVSNGNCGKFTRWGV